MRKEILTAILVGILLTVFGFPGCASRYGRPQPGDRITPELAWPISWQAGSPGQLAVRLFAQGKDDARPRLLDFSGVPRHVDPEATIRFQEGEEELQTVEVRLSHRC